MKILSRWALAIVLNLILFAVAVRLIPGFTLTGDWVDWFVVGFVLALLNFLVKPILKFFLAPVIILTLGVGLILINMFILYLLDNFSAHLTIQGISAFFFAAILFGIFNLIFHSVIRD